jgi:hypothetical protein
MMSDVYGDDVFMPSNEPLNESASISDHASTRAIQKALDISQRHARKKAREVRMAEQTLNGVLNLCREAESRTPDQLRKKIAGISYLVRLYYREKKRPKNPLRKSS